MGGEYEQLARLAVGLEIDPRNNIIAHAKRQDVISPASFAGGYVNLDPVMKIKQALGARSKPDHRVERRHKRTAVDGSGQPGAGGEVGLHRPTLDINGLQLSGLDQLFDQRRRSRRRHAEIVGKILPRRNAQRSRGNAQQFALGIRAIEAARQMLVGNDALRQIIDPLKVRQPLCNGEVAASEVILERPTRQRTMPVSGFSFRPR